MIEAAELQFSVLGRCVAARQWGSENGIPVIALHGWLDNADSFSFLAPHLSNINLVALDLAGHGKSEHRSADASYHIWDDIREILLVADALGWQQFCLMGHSRGAIIASLMAAVSADRVRAMVLLEGLWPQTIQSSEAASQLQKYLSAIQIAGNQPRIYENLEEMIAVREKGGFGLPADAATALVERNSKKSGQRYSWSTDPKLRLPSPMMLSMESVESFLTCVTSPALLVVGDKAMGKVEQSRYQPYASWLEVVEFPGGHHLHMEKVAPEIGKKVSDFLAQNAGSFDSQ